jgi:Domain of unknown function (DUF4398)
MRNHRSISLVFAPPIAALILFFAGCATAPRPISALSDAKVAIERANVAQAERDAPVEMRLAMEAMNNANSLDAAGKYEQARLAAERAAVHAELARMKALGAQARAEVKRREEENAELREALEGASSEKVLKRNDGGAL